MQGKIAVEQHPAIPGLAREEVADVLAAGRTRAQAITLVDKAAALDARLTGELASAEKVACRAGCAWCCSTTTVSTSAPEVIRIAEYLRARLAPDELRALRERLARRAARIDAMPAERQPYARIPCALLVKDRCSIYPVRPISCMGFVSSDAEACASSYRSGWQRAIPNGARHLGIALGVRQGLRQVLDDARLQSDFLDLNAALLVALDRPESADEWLAGKRAFAGAEV
jgi:Fe-S-cluster containining protein